MLPMTCPCGAEAVVVRLGPSDFRVECTVCRKNNVGPCKTRARAIFEWNDRVLRGRSVTALICEELYGKELDELSREQLEELHGRVMKLPRGQTKDRRDKL